MTQPDRAQPAAGTAANAVAPLSGKRILVTRARGQAAALRDMLAALGAAPIGFPTIEIAPLDDYTALDRAITQLERYQWVIFTSANGVAAFWERLASRGAALPPEARLAAIGPATARAIAANGPRATTVPDEYVAEALAARLGDVAGQSILLPLAEIAREALGDELRRLGASVDAVSAYRTLPAAPDPLGLAELQRGVDAITLTSASAARNLATLLGGVGAPDVVDASRALVACIGPITAQAARAAGLRVDVVARDYTIEGLVAALVEAFAR